jgi:hypothetical protein
MKPWIVGCKALAALHGLRSYALDLDRKAERASRCFRTLRSRRQPRRGVTRMAVQVMKPGGWENLLTS